MADSTRYSPDKSNAEVSGRTVFASVMLMVLGVFNIVDGIALLQRSEWFEARFIASNADTWGWIMIIFAALQIIAGVMLFRNSSGRGLGITLASIGMVIWFMLIFVMPFAALLGAALNFVVIAALIPTDEAG